MLKSLSTLALTLTLSACGDKDSEDTSVPAEEVQDTSSSEEGSEESSEESEEETSEEGGEQ